MAVLVSNLYPSDLSHTVWPDELSRNELIF